MSALAQRLARLGELERAATPPPWAASGSHVQTALKHGDSPVPDAAFIAAWRNAAPWLLGLVARGCELAEAARATYDCAVPVGYEPEWNQLEAAVKAWDAAVEQSKGDATAAGAQGKEEAL